MKRAKTFTPLEVASPRSCGLATLSRVPLETVLSMGWLRPSLSDLSLTGRARLLTGFTIILLLILSAIAPFLANAVEGGQESEIRTSSGNLVTRVAPGELLPVSVKLVNFGGGKRVDVTITYRVLSESGNIVLTETETVAVETTASFIKILQIPRDTPSGKYTAESNIMYQGQKVPATASYQFAVERKIAGMFASQFLIYGVITLIIGIIFVIIGRIVKKNFARVALRRMNILK